MAREIRLSPDGISVAIRNDQASDPEAWNAWGIMNSHNGGAWLPESRISNWTTIQEES